MERNAILYVIIVETGEYSDRCDWVGGVFDDKETAQRMIVDKSAVARETSLRYKEWMHKQYAVRDRFPQPRCWSRDDPELMEAIQREAGPAPRGGELVDQFYLVEVPMNQWGQFNFAGDMPEL
jgi:hypothetical protein